MSDGDRFEAEHVEWVDPPCSTCKHRDPASPSRCRAFPNGIPTQILLAKHDHRRPFPGDRGIRYEPREEPGKPESS